ncbi:transcription elongation factor GreA [soil metagenome]
MSVAFRRESDDEHLEPKFEMPVPAGPNLVTARGLAMIEAQVAELEAQLESDDEEARKLAQRDLKYWHTRRVTAEVAHPPEGSVGFGSRVTFTLGGVAKTMDIVGGDEADPAADRITFNAPLPQALIGSEPGEVFDFGGREVEVLSTGPIPE